MNKNINIMSAHKFTKRKVREKEINYLLLIWLFNFITTATRVLLSRLDLYSFTSAYSLSRKLY